MGLLANLAAGLKCFAAFWALVTFAVAAAFLARMDADFGNVDGTNFSAAGAIIAFGVIAFIWFTVYLVLLLFVSSAHAALALIVELPVLVALFVLGLGSVAALSTEAGWFNRFSGYSAAQLGNGTLALGWILDLLILGIIVFQLVVVLRHPRTMPTWRASFHDLANGGCAAAATAADAEKGGDVPMPVIGADASVAHVAPAAPAAESMAPAAPAVTAEHGAGHAAQAA